MYSSGRDTYTDMFAFGTILYRVLTGKDAFDTMTENAIKDKVCAGWRPSLDAVPAKYKSMVAGCWEHGTFMSQAYESGPFTSCMQCLRSARRHRW